MPTESQLKTSKLLTNYDDRKIKEIVQRHIVEQECESWIVLKNVLNKHLQLNAQLETDVSSLISRYSYKISNIFMLMYIYYLDKEGILKLSRYQSKINYRNIFKSLKEKSTTLTIAKSWFDSLSKAELGQTSQLVVNYLSDFYVKELIFTKQDDVKFLLQAFNSFNIECQRHVQTFIKFVNNLQRIQIEKGDKEIVIIKLIAQILNEEKPKHGNMTLIFTQYIIGKVQERNIEKFCYFCYDFFIQISQQNLLKIFYELTKSSINQEVLLFITKVSKVLVEEQEFYKLKILYQKFILPIIARRMKACTKQKVGRACLQLCQLYVIGFLCHCEIGKNGIYCLLDNIHQVKEELKVKWIQLVFLVVEKEINLTNFVKEILDKSKIDEKQSEKINKRKSLSNNQFWQITKRNCKKRKVYQYYDSDISGIENQAVQCYIISIVQAFFMTKCLPKIFNQIQNKKFRSLIESMDDVFSKLRKNSTYGVKVNDLKRRGPKYFAQSQTQQDAQQYLISLFDQLENELIKNHSSEEKSFKKVFQIKSLNRIKCLHCGLETSNQNVEYVHTLCHKQSLSIQSEEQLDDFQCSECHQRKCKRYTKLELPDQIFIVHINRFSHKKGKAKKQLATQTIPRKFQNFDLVGMVVHIGKNVECGHYIYYSKVNDIKWLEMNDKNVKQFKLDSQNEPFEAEMKAEKTPYLLWYKKVK